MFNNKEKKLYEKEIRFLQKQNKELLARCERAERYMRECVALNKQMKSVISKYDILKGA